MVVRGVDVPKPKRGEVLLKVLACGICRLGWHLWRGDPSLVAYMEWSGGKLPIIPGHEVAGQVVEVGDGAKVVVIYGGRGDPREVIQRGADEIVLLREAHPRDYLAHADAVARLIAEKRPWAVLAPATSYGRDLMAKVLARLSLG